MAFTSITVTGTFLYNDGTPATGKVAFVTSVPMQDASTRVVREAVPRIATLAAGGVLSIVLPANDDPTTAPSGVTYTVTEYIDNAPQRQYSVVIPRAAPGGTIDLSGLAPVNNTGVTYIALQGPTGATGATGLTGTPGATGSAGTGWLNVRDPAYAGGAKGDGTTDDTAAFVAIRQAAGPGSLIYIAPGTYIVSDTALYVAVSNIVNRGAGMFATTIKAKAGTTVLSQITATPVANIAFEDMTFDGSGIVGQIVAYANATVTGVRFSRCRFIGATAYALNLNGVNNVVVEDCIFDDQGAPTMTAMQAGMGSRDWVIRRNRFLWVNAGILSASGSALDAGLVENLRIEDNYFDLGWFLLPTVGANSGGTVTYGATSLTDTAAAFTGLNIAVNDNVRIMPVLATGNSTSVTATSLTDTAANFVTAGIRRGHIVRTGGLFAVVSGIESATVVRIEQWWHDTNRSVQPPPALGTYTVYDCYLNRVSAVAATVLTFVNQTFTLDGAQLTPVAGTRYEVLRRRPGYCINLDTNTRACLIERNTLRRGWSDQISVFGSDHAIVGNFVEWGQDEGITAAGPGHTISGNRIRHQGSSCIFGGRDGSITGNVCTEWMWTVPDTANIGAISLTDVNNTVTANRIRKGVGSITIYGIVVNANGQTVDGNVITSAGTALTAGVFVKAGVTGTKLGVNDASLIAPTVAVGGALGTAPPAPTVVGADASHSLSFGTGSAPPGGGLVATVTFANVFAAPPRITLTPTSAGGASMNVYVTGKTASSYSLGALNTPAASQPIGSYTFDVAVIG